VHVCSAVYKNRWSLIALVALCFAVLLPSLADAGSTCSNTYRHIYNYSRCEIYMWVYPTAGNMYCNGGKNAFHIQPHTSPEYELTTSDCVSAGKIEVKHLAHGDMILDYRFSNTGMNWFKSSYGGTWGAANVDGCGSIGWEINSPAMGDITFRD